QTLFRRFVSGQSVDWSAYNIYTVANVAKRLLISLPGGLLSPAGEHLLLTASQSAGPSSATGRACRHDANAVTSTPSESRRFERVDSAPVEKPSLERGVEICSSKTVELMIPTEMDEKLIRIFFRISSLSTKSDWPSERNIR
ncbi:unnamed protein product, partial [Protopolystoma xenopodis]